MTRRLLAILAAVLLAALLVAAAVHGLDALAYVLAGLVGGGALVYLVVGAKDGPRLTEDLEHATARTRQLTLDTSRRAGVIDLTAHRERLGVADETRPNKRRTNP